ncbi:MAG: Gfo/Idh/MocA family oxidoreductase [Armatimonadetes bacterium]|nr:Gfo/Idh/MocA family oxidoreductase [Armatimonadota bacterium]MDE2207227.1 Gfo/Idh/MocA family oxidoreductase [Armatimonadota bacterium]
MAELDAGVRPAGVGVIGCGNISDIYFQAGRTFSMLNIRACADLIHERAVAKAEKHNIPRACSNAELLADPEIEIVINITTPDAHHEVCLATLEAGKNSHVEKPLSLTREQGKELLAIARQRGLRLGGAPDTFLGGGLQTCRKLIDDGWIGRPIAATAFLLCHGHESWHPDPAFYYEVGGGPMFDMGPYYLTALITLLGPIRQVSGATRITFPQRIITSQPHYGERIQVEVPTHVAGILEFSSGAVATLVTSFDVWSSTTPCIEIYGTEGTLLVPDPNTFGGPVRVRRMNSAEWSDIPLTHGFAENSRGVAVADMASALRSGRPHRASGDLAYHVLEAMHGFHDAASSGQRYSMESTCERPEPLAMGLPPDRVDA